MTQNPAPEIRVVAPHGASEDPASLPASARWITHSLGLDAFGAPEVMATNLPRALFEPALKALICVVEETMDARSVPDAMPFFINENEELEFGRAPNLPGARVFELRTATPSSAAAAAAEFFFERTPALPYGLRALIAL